MTFANQPIAREGHKQCPRCGALYDVVASYCQKDGAVLVLENDTPDPYIGQVLLQQFKIEEQVGAGGMGTVYRAHQKTLDRDVAIKILHPELVRDKDAVQRFRREARVTTSLEHPNIVNVFLFGQLPDKNLYLVMEYLEGRSLIDVLAEDGPLSLERRASYCDSDLLRYWRGTPPGRDSPRRQTGECDLGFHEVETMTL